MIVELRLSVRIAWRAVWSDAWRTGVTHRRATSIIVWAVGSMRRRGLRGVHISWWNRGRFSSMSEFMRCLPTGQAEGIQTEGEINK